MDGRSYRAMSVAFALSLAGALASYVAAGATLGLLIGSVAFIALITPPMALAVSQRSERGFIAIASVLGNAVVWMFSFPIVDALRCGLILLAFALALVALTHGFRSARIRRSIAPALTTILALAWLSFPIWLRSDRSADLVAYHPIFAMNGVVKSIGIWTQQPILYRLTTLGQDVSYELPTSIWLCVIAYGVIALLLLIPARAGDELSDR
ncbi:MAG: hypothetical protein H7Z14_13985 [Anaerolineae bacterium]|nr:hypothetical protein [Phycisphaerae bacterium]